MIDENTPDLERIFQTRWRQFAPSELPEPEHDTVRPVPNRRFRLDWAWPDARVGVDCQGGVYGKKKRGHTRPSVYLNDCWKLAHCLANGWLVFWVTEKMLMNEPDTFIELVAKTVRERLTNKAK